MTRLKEMDEKVAAWVAEGGLKKLEVAQTPDPNGSCKDCKGTVVRHVTGLFRGNFSYANPACERCGRVYLHTENSPKVGAEEFLDSLNQPMTI